MPRNANDTNRRKFDDDERRRAGLKPRSSRTGRRRRAWQRGRGMWSMNFVAGKDPYTLSAEYKNAAKRLTTYKPALKEAAKAMQLMIAENVADEGSRVIGQPPWRGPTRRYKERKRKSGDGSRVLKVTGAMVKAATKNKPLQLTKRKLKIGLKTAQFKQVADVQFSSGYWFIAWTREGVDLVQKIMSSYIDAIVEGIKNGTAADKTPRVRKPNRFRPRRPKSY